MKRHRPKKVSILANPIGTVVFSVAGITASVWALAGTTLRNSSVALLIGLGIGLPVLLLYKAMIRRLTDLYVADLTRTADIPRSLRMVMTNLSCALLFLVAAEITIQLDTYFHVPRYSGIYIMLALSILVYPEAKAIYRAAQARIAQSQSDPGEQETAG